MIFFWKIFEVGKNVSESPPPPPPPLSKHPSAAPVSYLLEEEKIAGCTMT